jgi:hypothetical protein
VVFAGNSHGGAWPFASSLVDAASRSLAFSIRILVRRPDFFGGGVLEHFSLYAEQSFLTASHGHYPSNGHRSLVAVEEYG